MRCRHARKMISRDMDDELNPHEKKDFDAHIRSCASCREALEDARSLQRLFASAPRFPAPYGFATKILANLEEKEGSQHRGFLSIRPFFLRTAQVVFALIVMTIGIFSGSLLLAERTNPIGQTDIKETFSLDLFQATPPDSMGGIYYALMRPGHER